MNFWIGTPPKDGHRSKTSVASDAIGWSRTHRSSVRTQRNITGGTMRGTKDMHCSPMLAGATARSTDTNDFFPVVLAIVSYLSERASGRRALARCYLQDDESVFIQKRHVEAAGRAFGLALLQVVCVVARAARCRLRASKNEGRADSPPWHGRSARATVAVRTLPMLLVTLCEIEGHAPTIAATAANALTWLFACAFLLWPGALPGQTVAVRHAEALVHGFFILRTLEG